MEKISRLQQYERLFREKFANKVIKAQLKHRGISVTVFRKKLIPSASENNPTTDAQDLSDAALSVFGDFSGVSPGKHEPIKELIDVEGNISFCARIVITKIPNSPFDAASTGMLEKQILYTMDDLVPQDLIEIKSDDGTIKRGVVGQIMQWGLTDSVYKTFEYNNLGDSLDE
ncbi:MAG: hypothetical protein WC511_02525 [Candidatus Pacearchaeota archaeon]